LETSIIGGKIVTSSGIYPANIGIEDGKISILTSPSNELRADTVIRADGKYVIPGLIDPHSHMASGSLNGYLERFEREITQETTSVAYGGVTTFFTKIQGQGFPVPIEKLVNAINKLSIVDFPLHVGVGTMKHVGEFEQYCAAGVSSFKYSLAAYPEFGVAAPSDAVIYAGLRKVSKMNYPAIAMFHPEMEDVIVFLREELQREGRDGLGAWVDSRPEFTEFETFRRIGEFSKLLNCPVYMVHITCKESLDLSAGYRADGARMYVEAQPHHLVITRSSEKGILAKGNPPVREKEDIAALWVGLSSGIIDCMGSDHINTKTSQKLGHDIWSANPGWGPDGELMLPVLFSEGVKKSRISLPKLVEVTSYNPSKIFGLYPKKGTIQIESDADLVIVDPTVRRKVTVDRLHSVSDFSLYEGMELTGWPVSVILRGNLIVKDDKLLAKPGQGQYLPRYPKAQEEN
jgi:dihydropyrimidinase